MQFPARFSNLPDYAFPRLRSLLDGTPPGGPELSMSIGEPRHPYPSWIEEVHAEAVSGFARYPANNGTPELLESIAAWLKMRFGAEVDPARQVLPLNGTREGLYNVGMALFPEEKNGQRPTVLIPNPFYQVYMFAALSAGAEPVFVPATEQTGFLPDYASLPEDVLNRCVAAYICTPSNPQGAVAGPDYWRDLLALAERHDFRLLSDECYSEIYRGDSAPVGALQMVRETGADPERAVVFHSLSKRSNLPGLRSGFAAGGPKTIAAMQQLRAYAGAPLPLPTQAVSAAVWADEQHVTENRRLYAEKYAMAAEVLSGIDGWDVPEAGFFLWLKVRDSEEATLKLWRETGVRVLPGAYLARDVNGENPGAGYIRAAMVAPLNELRPGLEALARMLERHEVSDGWRIRQGSADPFSTTTRPR